MQKRLKSLKNITIPEGIMLKTNRSIQVEGAFGVLKEDHGFKRFLTKWENNTKSNLPFYVLGIT